MKTNVILFSLRPTLAVALFVLSAGAPFAVADSVYIENPSFENPVLADGTFQNSAPGWDFASMYNPVNSQHPGSTGNGTPSGADGIQVGYVYQSGSVDRQILRGPDGVLGTAD